MINIIIFFFFIITIVLIIRSLRAQMIPVPQEKRIVIYRWGKFSRIEGPGLVKIMKNLESVEREVYVRDQSLNFHVKDMFINGVPFGYRLNLWCRYDIEEAAGSSHAKLKRFAQCDDEERYQFASVKIQQAMRESLAKYEEKHRVGKDASVAEKLTPIIPGTQGCKDILNGATDRLAKSLPTVGVILNTDHAINVVGLHISDQIAGDFQRGRTVSQLREQFPELPENVLAQMTASIGNLRKPHTEHFHLEQSGEGLSGIDLRRNSDGTTTKRMRMRREDEYMGQHASQDETGNEEQTSPEVEPATAKPNTAHGITKEDVDVLKAVPPRSDGWRKSA